MKKTEIIAGWSTATYKGEDYYIVTTAKANTVWVPKDKFDTNAETITFELMKVGDEYTAKDGTTKKRTKDGNNFVCCGKQVMQKFESQQDMLEFMASKGMKVSMS